MRTFPWCYWCGAQPLSPPTNLLPLWVKEPLFVELILGELAGSVVGVLGLEVNQFSGPFSEVDITIISAGLHRMLFYPAFIIPANVK